MMTMTFAKSVTFELGEIFMKNFQGKKFRKYFLTINGSNVCIDFYSCREFNKQIIK